MVILGVDPGLQRTGYGLVAREGSRLRALDFGAIETAPDRDRPGRLLAIAARLQALLARYRPGAVAVESLFVNRNVRTGMHVGEVRGVVLLTVARSGLAVYEYTPSQVKRAVTGQGAAGKEQVAYMVRLLLGLPAAPAPADAADALAVAICCVHDAPNRHGWERGRAAGRIGGGGAAEGGEDIHTGTGGHPR